MFPLEQAVMMESAFFKGSYVKYVNFELIQEYYQIQLFVQF